MSLKYHIHDGKTIDIAKGSFTFCMHVEGPISISHAQGTYSLKAHQDICKLILRFDQFKDSILENIDAIWYLIWESMLLKELSHSWMFKDVLVIIISTFFPFKGPPRYVPFIIQISLFRIGKSFFSFHVTFHSINEHLETLNTWKSKHHKGICWFDGSKCKKEC